MSVLESQRVRDLLDRAGLGGLPPRTLSAVLGLAAVVMVFALWRFWPSAPAPEVPYDEMPPVERAAESASEGDAVSAEVVVHVAGAVMRPGVYRLDAGSRVDDAVRVAGGGVGAADLDSLNLARILTDGEQVYVLTVEEAAAGVAPPSGPPGKGGSSGLPRTVNINTASIDELDTLPGVGPSTARKIVDDREANGPFRTPEDLMRVPGIGEKKFESLREYVVCG